ncbi:MAG: 4a-hydroxytetrahydrobiopterin dehydratase [Ignavibacteriales bacterium]|nr:4a-hydroxytetrahydrobiopterin dehydratase [Ignavibacteriales bacterium]
MDLSKKKCVPCEGFSEPLSMDDENKYLAQIKGWQINRDDIHKINKEYNLLHFKDSMSFVNQIADLAENEGHHPNILIIFNKVKIEIFTHAISGLSENDFILAYKIDEIFESEYKI